MTPSPNAFIQYINPLNHRFPSSPPPKTLLVSSSLPNSPRFLIAPTFGAFSLGCVASAFLYACCRALVLAAYIATQNHQPPSTRSSLSFLG